MDKPLAGIKVLELATFVAAPCGTRLLADLGATVIKVESPSGDAWRKTGVSYLPRRFSEDENPVFDIYNAGKKHIAINLKTPEGMEVFHKLLSESDVFVTNNRPQSLKRLGLTYEDLKDKYPNIPITEIVIDSEASHFDNRLIVDGIDHRISKKGAGSVDSGVQYLQSLFYKKYLFIYNKPSIRYFLPDGHYEEDTIDRSLQELESYQYDKNKSEITGLNCYKKEMDHSIDATRYIIEEFKDTGRAPVV